MILPRQNTDIQSVIPSCAQSCFTAYVNQEFSCSSTACLCSNYSQHGFTIGELAYGCVSTSCSTATVSQESAAYDVCNSQPSPATPTHNYISLPVLTPTITPSPASTTSAASASASSATQTSIPDPGGPHLTKAQNVGIAVGIAAFVILGIAICLFARRIQIKREAKLYKLRYHTQDRKQDFDFIDQEPDPFYDPKIAASRRPNPGPPNVSNRDLDPDVNSNFAQNVESSKFVLNAPPRGLKAVHHRISQLLPEKPGRKAPREQLSIDIPRPAPLHLATMSTTTLEPETPTPIEEQEQRRKPAPAHIKITKPIAPPQAVRMQDSHTFTRHDTRRTSSDTSFEEGESDDERSLDARERSQQDAPKTPDFTRHDQSEIKRQEVTIRTPLWEPKITPSRRGDDLYLRVQLSPSDAEHFW